MPPLTWACAFMESSGIGSCRILLWSGLVVSRRGAAGHQIIGLLLAIVGC